MKFKEKHWNHRLALVMAAALVFSSVQIPVLAAENTGEARQVSESEYEVVPYEETVAEMGCFDAQ